MKVTEHNEQEFREERRHLLEINHKLASLKTSRKQIINKLQTQCLHNVVVATSGIQFSSGHISTGRKLCLICGLEEDVSYSKLAKLKKSKVIKVFNGNNTTERLKFCELRNLIKLEDVEKAVELLPFF